jgi:hypothetical protein
MINCRNTNRQFRGDEMSKGVNIRKCEIGDMELIVRLRLEFLKEAGYFKKSTNAEELFHELEQYIRFHINNDLF